MGETLPNLMRENAEAERAAAELGPIECPIDGEVLQVNAEGVRNCPLGNFRWQP